MNALVLYGSQYGNTSRSARAVAAAPTQRFRPTPAATEFLKGLAPGALSGVRAAFDTRIDVREAGSRARQPG